ncbi:MAG: hypothetical protein DME65_10285 [Verrucomicrobia bacterium]|nr:MAG: hypothetical protein DME65_10285 [Verrucomicrobiota bacterium]
MPTAAEIYEPLRFVTDFIDHSELRSESQKILPIGLIPVCVTDEIINEMPLCQNGLRSSENR